MDQGDGSGAAGVAAARGVVGFRCAVCEASVDIATPMVFRCPRWTPSDPYHALRIVQHDARVSAVDGAGNPFLAYRPYYAWDSFAAAAGLADRARANLVTALDERIARVDGAGFMATPFHRATALSEALGFVEPGGVWIKDETHQVAGSHKSRHLMSTLLYLLSVEEAGLAPWGRDANRPPLAIASCGNAALAAATLAAAATWPLLVFVPTWADPWVLARLDELGATTTTCTRRSGDVGDPSVARFREAMAGGAVAFGVQGPENVWCLDGGRSIAWEMGTALAAEATTQPLDHLFIQVGGGALARSALGGFAQMGPLPKLHAVQAEGCAPLARAWRRAHAGAGGLSTAGARWRECMVPWDEPHSAADGILDDETYDWLGVVSGMAVSHGAPVIAREAEILAAHALAHEHTGVHVSHTGSAGLAGLLAIRDVVSNHERVAVVFSGIGRDG